MDEKMADVENTKEGRSGEGGGLLMRMPSTAARDMSRALDRICRCELGSMLDPIAIHKTVRLSTTSTLFRHCYFQGCRQETGQLSARPFLSSAVTAPLPPPYSHSR